MNQGILSAEINEGPFRGWPLGATIAIASGMCVEDARRRMLDFVEEERTRLSEFEAKIRALPDPGPEAAAALVPVLPTTEL